MITNLFYKVEGNIIYPNKNMLTWGPFYYHSKEKAINRVEDVLNDIIDWCNSKDSTLHIIPQNIIKKPEQVVFKIQAWKDEETLQECNGVIDVELVKFED